MKTTTAQALLKKVQQNYNDIAEEFSHTRVYPWKDIDILTKYIKEGDNVLDIGCGNGRLNESLKDKKIFYNGIDNSINLIIKAQHKYPEQYFQMAALAYRQFENIFLDIYVAL